MSYHRVIPRDLFNEAKLLKCLGRLALFELDGKLARNVEIIHDDPETGFDVCQNEDDGSIYVSNIHILLDGEELPHYTGLNARECYPLVVVKDDSEYFVFSQKGEIMPHFLEPSE